MSHMIPRFIDVLQQANFDLTAEEVADTLWLALQMALTSREIVATSKQQLPAEAPSQAVTKLPEQHPEQTQLAATTGQTTNGGLYPFKPLNERGPYLGGRLARIPAAPALAEPLALGRALRPLRRQRPSQKTVVLNERATVQQIAATRKRIWAPVLEPAPIRWFEIALVIDEGTSMFLWRQTIAELRTLLERLGAFRDIRVWRLTTDNEEHVHLYAEAGSAIREQPARNPAELIDPTGHRLILVVTDCVSPAWYSGEVLKVLELWGKKNLVTILQMLPRQLWPRTAICTTEKSRFSASTPGTANVQLKNSALGSRFSSNLSIPFPAVILDQQSLASWAHLVMGTKNTRVTGIMFRKDLNGTFDEPPSPKESEDSRAPVQRVRDFRAAASPTACKLAGLLSAAPTSISLPIVHLVQQTMLPESTQVHVAEVFLGGLLKEPSPDHTATHPDYVEYTFFPGVQEELLSALPMPDAHLVGKKISAFIVNHLGSSRDFIVHIATPAGEPSINWESRPFATIPAESRRKFGEEYAAPTAQPELQLEEPPAESTVSGKAHDLTLAQIRSDWPSDIPVLNRTCICPSCFEEIYIGDCRIISGITSGKVLKDIPYPRGYWERQMARLYPEPLYSAEYATELAQRECPKCSYLLPYNIERVQNITLAVVGDVFTGKSYYMAALIHQIQSDWIGNTYGLARFTCLTPEVEKEYMKNLFEPLFLHKQQFLQNKQQFLQTKQAIKKTADPLIYELVVNRAPQHPPGRINLILYDTSGEDYQREDRLVQFARFIFNTSAFIFMADPVMMVSIFTQLPTFLQSNLIETLHLSEERRAVERLNYTLSLYERFHGYSVGSSFTDIPIAVMLSKADLLNYLDLPHRYSFMKNPHYGSKVDLQDIGKVDQEVRDLLRAYDQGDLLAATSRFKQVKFFATSATGEPPDETGHFRKVEPFRCLDPLLWILYQHGIIEASE